ncbi:unnamed protein product, partial [Ectocarpus sp. 12 AP-2014]
SGGWGTSRHYAVPTTDVAVRELPRTLAWFNRAMRTRIGPTVAVAAAAGAPTPPPPALMLRRLRVHDAFVVRYDAAAQRSLPLHTDQGELSLTISLNGTDEYEGGGTWFEGLGRAVRPEEAGHVVVFPGGRTVHGG